MRQNQGMPVEKPAPSSWKKFLRLWFVLGFAYFALRLIFNLSVMGWIDVRPVAFLDLTVVPLGQAAVLWMVTRRARQTVGAGEDPYGSDSAS